MANARARLEQIGVTVPELYLPSDGVDYRKWAVVACDQYSSEREYWEDVEREVDGAPSTLRLIFPECYLEDGDKELRIAAIQKTMRDYIEKGILVSKGQGFMLVERTTPFEESRGWGLWSLWTLSAISTAKIRKVLFVPPKVRSSSACRRAWRSGGVPLWNCRTL